MSDVTKIYCKTCKVRIPYKRLNLFGMMDLPTKALNGVEYEDGWKCNQCGGNKR